MFSTVIIIGTFFVRSPKLKISNHYQDHEAAQFIFCDPASEYGYEGYDEDDQDISQEDEKDNDLERRIEEFIAKVTGKWREELLVEGPICITGC